MNLRSYVRILRPVTVLAVAGAYTQLGAFQLQRILKLPAEATAFYTLALLAPLLVGAMVAGAAHELMHQRFFLLLPGARQQLRRWTLATLAGVWVILVGLAAWWLPALVVPVAGMSAAVLTLPLLNRRGGQSPRRMLLFGGAILGGCVLLVVGGAQILAALQSAGFWIVPAAFGLAAGVAGFAFRPAGVRERSGRFFQSMQTAVWALFRPYAREALTNAVEARLKGQATAGRDWRSGAVDGSPRQWIRVLLHEMQGNCGAVPRWLRLVVVGMFASLLPVALSLAGAQMFDGKMTMTEAIQALAVAGAPGAKFNGPASVAGFSIWLPAWIAWVIVFVRVLPRAVYPISRDRFAWCVFLLAQRQIATAVGVQLLSMVTIMGGAGLIAGTGLRWENLQLHLTMLLVQWPFLPLLQSAALLSRGFLRVIAGFVLVAGVVGTMLWLREGGVVSWGGLTVSLACFAATSMLHWRLLRRELRGRDLDRGFGLLLPRGAL